MAEFTIIHSGHHRSIIDAGSAADYEREGNRDPGLSKAAVQERIDDATLCLHLLGNCIELTMQSFFANHWARWSSSGGGSQAACVQQLCKAAAASK